MMAYDAADRYTVLFGGYEGYSYPFHDFNDTWTYRDGVWTEIFPRLSPPALSHGSLTMDPLTGCDVLFGGGIVYAVNETWVFCHGTWTNESSIPSPSPRWGAATATDYQCDCIVLFGGDQTYRGFNDTWIYQAGTWTEVTPTVSPPELDGASMSWDSSMGTAILTSGLDGELLFTYTWEFNFLNGSARWQNITSARSPPPRYASTLVDAPSEHGVLLFGGWLEFAPAGSTFALNDTWLMKNGVWYNETPQGANPGVRGAAAVVFAESDDCPVLFGGGIMSGGHEYQDTWTFGCPPVTFSEVGLPADQSWLMSVNFTVYNVTAPSITFYLGNGLYPFTIGAGPTMPSGEQYSVLPPSGAVFVSGTRVMVNVTYQLQYMVAIEVSSFQAGWVSNPGGWVNANSTYWVNATPNAGFTFLRWQGTGSGSYTGTNAAAVLVANSPITELAIFGRITKFQAIFEESGLPRGLRWSVRLNGTTMSSANESITATLPNGTLPYLVLGPPGYSASPSDGNVSVRGQNLSAPITFTANSTSSWSPFALWTILGTAAAIVVASAVIAWYRIRRPKKLSRTTEDG